MHIAVCESCGQEYGISIRFLKKKKCVICNAPLKSLYNLTCGTCNTINKITSFNDLKNRGCSNCKYPLNWSLPKGTFFPNFIPLKTRLKNTLLASMLIAYSVYGLISDKLDLPYGSKKFFAIAHFHGHLKLIPLFGLLILVASLLSVLVDHADTRANERKYEVFSYTCSLIVFCVYIAAGFFASNIEIYRP